MNLYWKQRRRPLPRPGGTFRHHNPARSNTIEWFDRWVTTTWPLRGPSAFSITTRMIVGRGVLLDGIRALAV
jgi:hypothetical protein